MVFPSLARSVGICDVGERFISWNQAVAENRAHYVQI